MKMTFLAFLSLRRVRMSFRRRRRCCRRRRHHRLALRRNDHQALRVLQLDDRTTLDNLKSANLN
jgi:hypothetical protein